MPQWPVAPSNAILVGGLPLFHEYEAYATIYPGFVVEFTGADDPALITYCSDGGNPVGVADIAMAYQTGRGSWRKPSCENVESSTKDLPYLSGDQVEVISGPVIVMLVLDANENIIPGDKLMCAGSGLVKEYYCLTTSDPCALVAEAIENVVTGGGECAYIMAKLLI